jgi:CRISPR system Cascade subunit CasB
MKNQEKKRSRNEEFVTHIIGKIQQDKGIAAALRRADNPETEYQSWEYLAAFNIPLDNPFQRLPHATIAAAIAKAKLDKNGTVSIGRALASCYEDGSNSEQAKAKLRRLLACDSIKEVCRILRPIFSLIHARSSLSLNYVNLLDDLLKFNGDYQSVIKSRWAQNFYSHPHLEGEEQ